MGEEVLVPFLSWSEWENIIEKDGVCPIHKQDIAQCDCHTEQSAEIDNWKIIEKEGRKWAMKPIYETEEYQEKLQDFNSITDRPITMFVYFDKEMPLDERIVVLDLEEANKREAEKLGGILLLCFNEPIKVRTGIPADCDVCECSPCDCDWGIA